MKGWNADDYQSNSDYYKSLEKEHSFQQSDSLRIDRLYSPQFHPIHGKTIIYLRQQFHMSDLRKSTTTLHLRDLETNKTVQLTRPVWGKHDRQFYWINSDTILFLSNRAPSGVSQIFQLKVPADVLKIRFGFVEPIQLTDFPLSILKLLVNRQGTRLAFSCEVYPNLTIEQTYSRYQTEKNISSSFYQFDKLFIRHWDTYMTRRRNHPFVASIEENTDKLYKFSSKPVDVLFSVDSGSQIQWSFSASGNSFAYIRRHEETSAVAWTGNNDIYTVELDQRGQPSICITCGNLATNTNPSYSPTDDNVLIYLSQIEKDYGEDQVKIIWYNTSNSKQITILENWDRRVKHVTWSPNGQSVFLEVNEEARNVIYHLENLFNETSLVRLTHNGTSDDIDVHPINHRIFTYTHGSFLEPTNIYLYSSNKSIRSLTKHNQEFLSKVRMSTNVEKFSFVGARNDTVEGWYIAPIDSAPTPAPLLFYIHGGPHVAYCDKWSYSWNLQTYASQGYAVIVINFHGSDSYGQNFKNSIVGEFGSLPYEDLNKGLTYALKKYPNIDSNRVVAYGGSYGGYMVYWIAGQPEMSHRFKTLISNNGIFDLRAMAYSTDELSFGYYYFGTAFPWVNPDALERFNPVNHVANWSQPMLISVGAQDYRVPEIQGISAFAALQGRGIEGKLLYFVKEGHSMYDPYNSITYHEQVLDWMRKWAS